MSNKIDTKGRSLADILRMRAELEAAAEARFDAFAKSKEAAFRKAAVDLKPALDGIYADTEALRVEAEAAGDDVDACD